ncbi:PA0613 family protein [Azotobacter vinelandii]
MIKVIDDLLRQWAVWRLAPGSGLEGGSGSMLGAFAENRGVLIRSTAGARCPLDRIADIELIYTTHLSADLRRLMRLHYVEQNLPDDYRWRAAKCSRAQYYRRLDLLHAAIAELLVNRRAA